MALKVTDIIKFVRTRLREPDPSDSHFSDEPEDGRPDLLSFLNDVRGEVCEKIPYIRTALEYIGTGSQAYPLPDNCLKVEKIMSIGVALRWLTVEDSGPYSPIEAVQSPSQFGGYGALIKGSTIHFLPSLSPGNRRTLHYIGMEPEILSIDSTLVAPASMRDVWGYAVLKEAYASLKNNYWAEWYEAKYDGRARQALKTTMRAQYPGIRAMRRPL